MKKITTVFMLTLLVSLSGCLGYDVPDCSSTDTIELVKQIARTELTRQSAATLGLADYSESSLKMKYIKAEGHNAQTQEHSCSCTLEIGAGKGFAVAQELPITYTSGVGTNEGGEAQHLVMVYGL